MRYSLPRDSQGLAAILLLFAIVGILAAVLIYNTLGAVSKRMDAVNTNAASFAKIHDSLTRYVMLYQRLPCPADPFDTTSTKGQEKVAANDYDCSNRNGILPWATIDLPEVDAIDPWGRYIFYRVYDGVSGFTRSSPNKGMSPLNCLDEETTTTYSLSGASSTCNATTHENSITDFFASKGVTVNDMGTSKSTIAYVLISPGETGYGGYYPGGSSAMTSPSASSKEYLNAGSGGTYWITAPSTGVAAGDATHFDDVLSYRSAIDVAKKAQLAGRPWALNTVFTLANAGVTTSNYNSGSSNYKIATTGGPIWVTAAGDSPRNICGMSVTPVGISACTTQTNGSDKLDSNTNERLTFDFRVTRKVAVVQLTDFKATGGGDNERAQITFYNAAGTQVDQKTMTACATSGTRIGQSTLTAAADFTKIEVRAITKTGGGQSQFGISAIMACKIASDCNTIPGTWTAPVC